MILILFVTHILQNHFYIKHFFLHAVIMKTLQCPLQHRSQLTTSLWMSRARFEQPTKFSKQIIVKKWNVFVNILKKAAGIYYWETEAAALGKAEWLLNPWETTLLHSRELDLGNCRQPGTRQLNLVSPSSVSYYSQQMLGRLH